MSQSSITMQTPNPMKKKVIAALVAVVIGHGAVLWAVSHMRVPELQKIEKKPVQVKFLKIKEDVPPPPPPPAAPVKPKVKPVEKPVKPKPLPKPVEKKIVATKTQKVEQKQVKQDDTLLKQKLEQQRLDQLKRDQDARDKAAREQAAKDQAAREQAAKDQAKREQDERDRQAKLNQPRKATPGDIEWAKRPFLRFTNTDLGNQARVVVVRINATADGRITDVKVVQSSGIPSLDERAVKAIRGAKFRPTKDGRAIYGELPYEMNLKK